MSTETRTYTAMDFERLPEGPPCQLIDGELVMTPSATFDHQSIVLRIASKLLEFVTRNQLGFVVVAPMDVYLTEWDVYQPDVTYISNRRRNIIHQRIKGAPDLVVEVLSPSNAHHDLSHKKNIYEKSGVLEYWIVDPAGMRVEVLTSREGRFIVAGTAQATGKIQSAILPEFSLDLDDIFPTAVRGT